MFGEQLTVGVVTPHTAPGADVELPALSRGRVVTIVARTDPPSDASGRTSQPLASGVAGLRDLSRPAVLDRSIAAFGTARSTRSPMPPQLPATFSDDAQRAPSSSTSPGSSMFLSSPVVRQPSRACGRAQFSASSSFIRRGSTPRSMPSVSATSAITASTLGGPWP